MNTDKIISENKEKEEEKKSGIREKIAGSFLEKREIFFWGSVSDKSSETIVEKLLYLENENPGKPIYFFINSPGGVISSGLAVYDVIQMISSPVYTIAMGMAASMGAVLLAAGEPGHRYVFKHAKVMIHQPLISGQIVAPAIDIKIHAEDIKKTRNELNRILAEASGKKIEQIEKDTDRDYYMTGHEAVDYGLADHLLADFQDLQKKAGGSKAKSSTAKKKTTTSSRSKKS